MTAYALYLHIPFCRRRCSYCDFNTYTTLGELQAAYVAALAREIEQVGGRAAGGPPPVRTIFFGGGTPSLLTPDQVATLLDAAQAAFSVDSAAEITMEANPGTVDVAYLSAVRALGVNRLSYGVQSALPGELELLGREHSFAEAVAAVDFARAAGFDNLNLDLIYGLPGQSAAEWRQTLDAVLSVADVSSVVKHISLYCLTIEPGTPLQRGVTAGSIPLPDPDTAADQYEMACAALAAAGFGHYEISNWARPGHECQHNLIYWRNEPYLGLGAGAHGSAGGYRYHVVRQPRHYIRRMQGERPLPEFVIGRGTDWAASDLPAQERRSAVGSRWSFPLSAAAADYHAVGTVEAMSDTVITQLRLLDEGLDLDGFAARFGQPFDAVYGDTTAQLEEWALLRRANGRLLLTERGRFLSNQVFYRFV